MQQGIITTTAKTFKCFSCGKPITFGNRKTQNKSGKWVKMRFNLDGSEHLCQQEDKQQYKSTDEYSQNKETWKSRNRSRFLRWWHGYGKYRYKYGYKDSYDKYNKQEYNSRWEENNQKREEYKSRYYNKTLTADKALEILEVIKSEIENLTKSEKFRAIKNAYRKMCLKFHPDRYSSILGSKEYCQQKFIEATEAYEFLESAFMGAK